MDDINPSRAVLAAEALSGTLATLSGQVGELRVENKRHRFLIRCLGASLVFDFGLSVVLGWIGVTAHDASTRASRATAASVAAQRETCISSNEARKVQTDLWTYVLSEASQSPIADKERNAQFKVYILHAFAQRDCEVVIPR